MNHNRFLYRLKFNCTNMHANIRANIRASIRANEGHTGTMQPGIAFAKFAKTDRSYAGDRWRIEMQGRTEYGKQIIASIRMPRGGLNIYPSARRCVNAL